MFEEVLVEQNRHWRNIKYDPGIRRTLFDKALSYMKNDFIVSVCGVRRAGKSTLLKQLINHLIESEEVPPANILFLNLEDPVFNLYKDDVANLNTVFQDYMKLQDPVGKVYLFLDEVQFFKNWQVFVKSKYERGGIKLVVTGSNSRLLSSELVTLLSGRTLVLNVLPFSFKEILRARGIDSTDTVNLLAQRYRVESLFDEYLQYGGFPQVVFETDKIVKKDILKNYFQNIFYNDIVPRFEIKKTPYAEKLLYYLLTNVSTLISYNNLSKMVSLTDKTVKEYISYFSQSMMLFLVDRFAASVRKQISSPKKVYSIDNGLVNAIAFKLSGNFGPLFENAVALELLRRGMKFFYYLSPAAPGKEVDFFIPESEDKLLQVCYDLKNEKARKRELASVQYVMNETGIGSSIIITPDEDGEVKQEGCHIKIVPAWKFLLDEKPSLSD